jgi:HEAT repeat protein
MYRATLIFSLVFSATAAAKSFVHYPAILPRVLPKADDEPMAGGKKLSAWLRLLRDKDPAERRRAVVAIELIGATNSSKVTPALMDTLRSDKAAEVRRAAALGLGRTTSKLIAEARAEETDPPKVDDVRDVLATGLKDDKADSVREACASALGDLGEESRKAVALLAATLKDKHAGTQLAAADALRRIGRDAREAVADLQTLVGDKKAPKDARTQATLALGQIGSDATAALPTLKVVLGDAKSPPELRKAVAQSLGRMGQDASDAADILGAVLIEKNCPRDLRLAAVTTLDGFGGEARVALPALIKAMQDKDRYVQCLAMHAVGQLGKDLEDHRKNAVAALLRNLESSSLEVRISSVDTLGVLGADNLGGDTDGAIKKLDQMIKNDGIKAVREAAQAARDKIRPKAEKPKD